MAITFNPWFKTLISEKNIDLEAMIDVEGPSGLNVMPLQIVYDAILSTDKYEKQQIKKTLILIDFRNGDIVDYLKHLAKAIAR